MFSTLKTNKSFVKDFSRILNNKNIMVIIMGKLFLIL